MKEDEIKTLINEFISDIRFGMHSISAEYNRSNSRIEIEKNGLKSFKAIAETMKSKFTENSRRNYDLEIAFVWLINSISILHKIKTPYKEDVPIVEMSMQKWIDFCYENQVSIPT